MRVWREAPDIDCACASPRAIRSLHSRSVEPLGVCVQEILASTTYLNLSGHGAQQQPWVGCPV